MPDAVQLLSERVFAMSNYILKYGRKENVRYISHLDFIRMFHRSVRRADIPFVFSQGFNPHPVMNVAMPLSVGVTADGEYMKVGFDKEITNEDIDALNSALPDGFYILAWTKVVDKKPDITKINRAEYITEIETDSEFDADAFMANSELTVMKKTKSGEKEADIRPYIHEIAVIGRDKNILTLKMRLTCSNEYNLKPETVIDAMEKYCTGFNSTFHSVHRCCLKCGDKELL